MKISLFTGCVIPIRYPGMEVSIRELAGKLGIELVDMKFSCCPSPTGLKEVHFDSWLTLAARNLCIAEDQGLDIVTPCSGCANTLRETACILKNNTGKLLSVRKVLSRYEMDLQGTGKIFNLPELLARDEYLDLMEEKLVNPLINMRIGTHYGCHYLRPASVMLDREQDPYFPLPETMELVLESLGAEVMEYSRQELCCGAALSINTGRSEEALQITTEKLGWMNEAGINALAVTCPACFTQFDTGQALLKRKNRNMRTIPVFHIAELAAYALGSDPGRLNLNTHKIKPHFL